MDRSLEPELLDHLDPNEAAARQSREDLRRINILMGNPPWLQHQLENFVRPGERILEIGAGDGSFALGCSGVWAGLDLAPRPPRWPQAAEWYQVDVRRFTEWAKYPVVFGNLIFHQFPDDVLAELGEKIRAHARVLIACEPVRRRIFQRLFAALCPMIGAGEVTRHDGRVSIAAGFKGDEFPRKLGFSTRDWRCRIHTTWRGAYHFSAVRVA